MAVLSQRLAVLVVLLAVSNLATAVGAWVLVGRLDAQYSALLAPSNEMLVSMTRLTAATANAQRAGLGMLLADDPTELEASMVDLRKARADQAAAKEVLERLATARVEAHLGALEVAVARHREAGDRMAALAAGGDIAGALELRSAEVRPAYEALARVVESVAVQVQVDVAKESSRLSLRTDLGTRVLLSAGTWPLLLFGLAVVAFVTFAVLVVRTLRPMLVE